MPEAIFSDNLSVRVCQLGFSSIQAI